MTRSASSTAPRVWPPTSSIVTSAVISSRPMPRGTKRTALTGWSARASCNRTRLCGSSDKVSRILQVIPLRYMASPLRSTSAGDLVMELLADDALGPPAQAVTVEGDRAAGIGHGQGYKEDLRWHGQLLSGRCRSGRLSGHRDPQSDGSLNLCTPYHTS